MKHAECKDCELSNGNCGHHFEMDGITNYEIASLSACDQYENCMFFKSKPTERFEKQQDEWVRKEDVIHLLERWSDGYCYIEIPTDTAIKAIKEMGSGVE